ncbi:MAG: sugar-binding domain-containing protein [Paludibacter sp.]
MKKKILPLLIVCSLCISTYVNAQWTPKIAAIKTQWADDVDMNHPLPEYPRPQMTRTDWLNLNGQWEYKSGAVTDTIPINQTLPGTILVPFPIESTLSGVVKHFDRLWYRHMFEVPVNWSGKQIILHFGAVDWESEIFINGESMGIHKGGYDAFSYDITDKLKETGPQELIVRVFDPTRDYGQPRGKQTTAPSGAMYTCVTGIWQTVWLEPLSERSISSLKLIPDIDKGILNVTVNTQDSTGLTVTTIAYDGETEVANVSGKLNSSFTISIPNAKLWSPDSPFLYDLTLVLKQGDVILDSVSSYFGMRKISRKTVNGATKLYLNNEFVFQMGPLDQGYWPEGIYTAPTDNALKSDIEQEKALGFNMVRKHIKVEPQRWYYWADKLGILVWQDMPSANSYDTPSGVNTDQAAHELEMRRMINDHINSPAIIMWVMFNEGCGQFDTKGRVDLAYSLDPSRLVNQGSGGGVATPVSAGDVIDAHRYPSPLCEFKPNQASVSGEYGGVFYNVSGHQWGTVNLNSDHARTSSELVAMYSSLADQVNYYKTYFNLSAAIYTQITDVETEINGLLTYDRIPKADVKLFKAINDQIINENIISQIDVVPTSQVEAQSWKYTTTTPTSSWALSSFNDSPWQTAQGGFGTAGTPGAIIRTNWNSTDIWMRQIFTLLDLKKDEFPRLALKLHQDDNCEVYINGVLAGSFNGYTSDYEANYINIEARNALILNGKNVFAVHCHQNGGGQYIDAGIVKIVDSNDTSYAYKPSPFLGQTNLIISPVLSWKSGNLSKQHKIYLGTTATLTENDLVTTQADPSYSLTDLQYSTKYYWRIDEVCDDVVKTGYLWNFTTRVNTGLLETIYSKPKIYPNPIKNGENLTVELTPELINYESISLWSANGVKILNQYFTGNAKELLNINDCNLSSGIYFIRAEKDGRFSSPEKLVVF